MYLPMLNAMRPAFVSCRPCASHVLRQEPATCVPLPRNRRALNASRASVVAATNALGAQEEEPSPEKQALIAATRKIRDLGNARDAVGAVAALAELGASGVTPDLRAVTTTLVRRVHRPLGAVTLDVDGG